MNDHIEFAPSRMTSLPFTSTMLSLPKSDCACIALLAIVALWGERASAEGAHQAAEQQVHSPYNVGTRAELFTDTLLVRDSENVAFTFHQGKKSAANPLLTADRLWEGWRLEIFGSVIFDDEENIYKMWYIGESAEDFPDYATLYATSKDGIRWEKPLVGTVKSRRGGETNAVADGYILASVMKDKSAADANRRYRMICWKQRPPYGAHVLVSPDGLHWTQITEKPICASADVITAFYDRLRQQYAAFPKINTVVRGLDRRCFGLITSKDLTNWTGPQLVLTPDARDDAGALARIEKVRPILDRPDDPALMRTEFYGMGFYQAENCTIAFPWVLTVNANNRYNSNQEGPVEIQFASSRDLRHWDRPFRTPAISIGELGKWDASCDMTSAEAVRVGDEIRLYYSGGNYTHGTPVLFHDKLPDTGASTGRKTKYTSSIGMVSWGLDRFVSADGPVEGGILTTVPIIYAGDYLEINGRTKAGGKIVVDMLDAAGRPLDRLTGSHPFSGDDFRHRVRWAKGDVKSFIGKPVCLRFHLHDAELFSFAFRASGQGLADQKSQSAGDQN